MSYYTKTVNRKYNMKNMKIFIILFLTIIIVEMIGRYCGLNDYPLFQSSKEFEYIQTPNQNRYIYRNHFTTNEYSMRSKTIDFKDSLVVLLIGDSILYGGNIIDDDELASTILENNLSRQFEKKIRVLNISCKSWGPENNYQYLKKNGVFNADLIIYIANSGDAYDHITHQEVVGISEEYPKENFKLALFKLFTKSTSLIQSYLNKSNTKLNQTRNEMFDEGFQHLNSLSKASNIPIVVYLHPDIKEVLGGKYNESGIEIIKFCKENSIPLIKELDYKMSKELYDDDVHYNVLGQKFMSNILFSKIKLSSKIEFNTLLYK